MRKQDLLFDLDGTITNPEFGITHSVMYALQYFGIEVKDHRTLFPFIGPPLLDSFMNFYGFDKEKAQVAVGKYRDMYAQKGVFQNTLYKGVDVLIKDLYLSGYHIYLATSKPTVFARQIMDYFDLSRYFTYIGGSGLDGSLHYKADVITDVLLKNNISKEQAVMIGDRMFDIEGALQVGIDAIGVLYGYGNRQEMEACGCETIVETVDDLRACFNLK